MTEVITPPAPREGERDFNVDPTPHAAGEQAISGSNPSIGSSRRNLLLFLYLLVLPGIAVASFLTGRGQTHEASKANRTDTTEGAARLKPGPWGELTYIPVTISPPTDILPVRNLEAQAPRWFFKGLTRDDYEKLLASTALSSKDREELLNPAVFEVLPNGLNVTPPREIVVSLPPDARRTIYTSLARTVENWTQLNFYPTSSVDTLLQDAGVSADTKALFKKLAVPYGEYTMLTSMSCLMSGISDYAEKARLLKSLSRQNTLLLRLHLTPKSDIAELTTYWGKATWSTDVRAMLDSLAHVPGGTWLDVIELLPPLPTSQLYTYPIPDNPANGPPVQKDCHWTAFNFFRDPPDPKYANTEYTSERLKLDYFPITNDPRYGDMVFFALPDETVIHSAVFIAGDVVFTKNGISYLSPWTFSTISELEKVYSFAMPPGQKIKVLYYRNKYL
jgi:hypothetical protein